MASPIFPNIMGRIGWPSGNPDKGTDPHLSRLRISDGIAPSQQGYQRGRSPSGQASKGKRDEQFTSLSGRAVSISSLPLADLGGKALRASLLQDRRLLISSMLGWRCNRSFVAGAILKSDPRGPWSGRSRSRPGLGLNTQCQGDPPTPCMLVFSVCVPDRALVSKFSASDLR